MGATMVGVFALAAAFPRYLALCLWMGQFPKLWAGLMLAGCVLFFLPGVAHHVFCRALEWFYLRMGCQSLDDPSVKGLYRLLARIGDGRMKMQIVRMEFSQLV